MLWRYFLYPSAQVAADAVAGPGGNGPLQPLGQDLGLLLALDGDLIAVHEPRLEMPGLAVDARPPGMQAKFLMDIEGEIEGAAPLGQGAGLAAGVHALDGTEQFGEALGELPAAPVTGPGEVLLRGRVAAPLAQVEACREAHLGQVQLLNRDDAQAVADPEALAMVQQCQVQGLGIALPGMGHQQVTGERQVGIHQGGDALAQNYKEEYRVSTVVPAPFPWGIAAEKWAELRERKARKSAPAIVHGLPHDIDNMIEAAREAETDLVIIDTPPATNNTTLRAGGVADMVIVPTRSSTLDVEALSVTSLPDSLRGVVRDRLDRTLRIAEGRGRVEREEHDLVSPLPVGPPHLRDRDIGVVEPEGRGPERKHPPGTDEIELPPKVDPTS